MLVRTWQRHTSTLERGADTSGYLTSGGFDEACHRYRAHPLVKPLVDAVIVAPESSRYGLATGA